jgi:predicted GIY-YIG superfamily endonuclease
MKKSDTNWHVYLVECADRTLYAGMTNNLERRVATHNLGKGARYTAQRLPVKLVWSEQASDESAALRRELQIKSLSRIEKLSLIGPVAQR